MIWKRLILVLALIAAALPAAAADDPDFDTSTSPTVVLSQSSDLSITSTMQCTRDNNGQLAPACSMNQYIGMQGQAITVDDGGSRPSGKKGHPLCGGLDAKGNLQPLCKSVAATYQSQSLGKCNDSANQFWAPGGCWSCPTGYKETIHSTKGNKACRKGLGKKKQFAKATFERKRICPDGQFYSVAKRGSCWTCPPFADHFQYVAPTNKHACYFKGVKWESPQYPEPGIFGMPGGAGVALAYLKRTDLINNFMDKMAHDAGISNVARFKQEQWEVLRDDPNESPVLNAMIMIRMIAVATSTAGASTDEKALAAAFARYLQARRTFIAQDAFDAYEAWLAADELRRRQLQDTFKLAALVNYGSVPIDYSAQIMGALGSTASMGFGAAIFGTLKASGLDRLIIYEIRDPAKKVSSAERTARILKQVEKSWASFKDIAKQGVFKLGKAAGKKVAKMATVGNLLEAGPWIVASLAVQGLIVSGVQFYKIATARPKLEKRLRAAKQPVDLDAMLESDDGASQFLLYWSLASSPPKPFGYTTAQKKAFAKAYASR